MLNKPQPEPLITITTRVFPETHASLRRLQTAMGKSLPVVLKTVVRNFERNLRHKLTAGEWHDYETGVLTYAQMTARTKRSKTLVKANGNGVADGHDK